MNVQTSLYTKTLATIFALIRFFSSMDSFMPQQFSFADKRLATLLAFKRFIFNVDFLVFL